MSIPRATYRIQFREGMDFDGAAALAPYLRRLGVSHLYASPIFTAARGSTHGYDVADHNEIDPGLGGRAGFDRLVAALKAEGLKLLLDIVPNHMAAAVENPWWRSVVEWGEQSPFAAHFDIDWSTKLTLPLLGRPYEEAIAGGDVRLDVDRQRGWLGLALGDMVLPIHPCSYEEVLSRFETPAARKIVEIAGRAAPDADEDFHAEVRRCLEDGDFVAELARASKDPGFIEQVHAEQPWELIHWQEARRRLSYRRFFEITGLAGVRVEVDAVFDDVHRLTLQLVRDGAVDGLRIDHIDGLADPTGYLQRLRREIGPDRYLVVEKILEGEEVLPPEWPVDGTTGYEFIASVADLFADAGGSDALSDAYRDLAQKPVAPDEMVRKARSEMIYRNFEGELDSLARRAAAIAGTGGGGPAEADFKRAIGELVVAFPVYRTYGGTGGLGETDRKILEEAAKKATVDAGGEAAALETVVAILNGDSDMDGEASVFRAKFQQLTGPVMAKAVEDTFFYRYNPMIALNEVGGDPLHPPGGPERFHARMEAAAQRGDHSLLGTATHDTKRGEDARARLYALGEAPQRWSDGVARWRRQHASMIRASEGGPAPEPTVEWLVYQALAGIWPKDATRPDAGMLRSLADRVMPYLEKSLREAKLRTNWTQIDEPYESAVKDYASRLLSPDNGVFLDDFAETLEPFVAAGRVYSLAQTLLKLTAPGVPDIYQGSEGVDLSLVDPDNRRPIDFEALQRSLGGGADTFETLPRNLAHAKQKLIARVLAIRAERGALFEKGSYVPLRTSGPRGENLVAFARQDGGDALVGAVPRLILDAPRNGLAFDPEWWRETVVDLPESLSGKPLRNLLSGQSCEAGKSLEAGELLRNVPVVLLGT
ncbi:malto-oligosyltrehalose synthase [Aquibium oceanicum]|uniref:Malto-oligosyltrehalose synthase n=1 Tax=Aquibium oceanicum TaxID=1670800 RepID=A0A1L3SLY2_9HYPH|nr:malto-oligosyltrehalose synthase [Aquibium oceanicum]APH70355.1 malto-oligosyltrehalose synthase [Aquibium oceanicum]